MNCPVDYDNKVERHVMHPGLLPTDKTGRPKQDTLTCERKAGVGSVSVKKTGVDRSKEVLLNKGDRSKIKKSVSWRGPLVQHRSMLGNVTKGRAPTKNKRVHLNGMIHKKLCTSSNHSLAMEKLEKPQSIVQ